MFRSPFLIVLHPVLKGIRRGATVDEGAETGLQWSQGGNKGLIHIVFGPFSVYFISNSVHIGGPVFMVIFEVKGIKPYGEEA